MKGETPQRRDFTFPTSLVKSPADAVLKAQFKTMMLYDNIKEEAEAVSREDTLVEVVVSGC